MVLDSLKHNIVTLRNYHTGHMCLVAIGAAVRRSHCATVLCAAADMIRVGFVVTIQETTGRRWLLFDMLIYST